MSNHPNRSKGPKGPSANPAPTEIKSAREAAGLSQTAAADLVHSGLRTWQQWEAGDRRMHPGLWELFRIKIAMLIEHA
ncbi:helix-turn-helix domain-containing protein [Laribacter hongkongensis]|uniref:helix-turn-helix domain-containing protein n=1 Tax=Laribacter hongkongensis TaxID=168471 RepID=UPI0028262F08|nr:helix-turn-helix domain-containing protein [Laribacter hongkongensis]